MTFDGDCPAATRNSIRLGPLGLTPLHGDGLAHTSHSSTPSSLDGLPPLGQVSAASNFSGLNEDNRSRNAQLLHSGMRLRSESRGATEAMMSAIMPQGDTLASTTGAFFFRLTRSLLSGFLFGISRPKRSSA